MSSLKKVTDLLKICRSTMVPTFFYRKCIESSGKKERRVGGAEEEEERKKERQREGKKQKKEITLAIDKEALLTDGRTIDLWVLPSRCMTLAPPFQTLCSGFALAMWQMSVLVPCAEPLLTFHNSVKYFPLTAFSAEVLTLVFSCLHNAFRGLESWWKSQMLRDAKISFI